MSSNMASSDPVDLEKGVTLTGTDQELPAPAPAPAVDPRKSMCIKLLLDASALLHVLFFVGFMAWAIMVSDAWWHPLAALFILLPILVSVLCMTPMMKEACIPRHGTEEGSDHSDHLSTKLLAASSSNKE